MIIISPAKRQNPKGLIEASTKPYSLNQTQILLDDMAQWSESDTRKELHLSEALATEAFMKNQALCQGTVSNIEPIASLGLYAGDVFKYLDVATLSVAEIDYLQAQLRIISALYGLLKPQDGIWPYRLEMSTRLPNHPSLPDFWRDTITEQIIAESPEFLVNLASKEYASCVDFSQVSQVIDIVFQDQDKQGNFRVIAVKAKRMRGLMLRYMAQKQVQKADELLAFKQNGYVINEAVSSPSRLVFQSR